MAAARSWNLRKTLPRAIVFLLLGAVLNVAVAWACALWTTPVWEVGSSSVDPLNEGAAAVWGVEVPDSWPSRPRVGQNGSGLGRTTTIRGAYHRDPDATDGTLWWQGVWQAGLPLRAMAIENRSIITEKPYSRDDQIVDGAPAPKWLHPFEAIPFVPLRPVWPGFAINTLFYAAILWVLLAAPGVIRRRIRRKRGRCPACGYRIAPGTGEVCSECGAAVPQREEVAT